LSVKVGWCKGVAVAEWSYELGCYIKRAEIAGFEATVTETLVGALSKKEN
jgi:hypothetical protein